MKELEVNGKKYVKIHELTKDTNDMLSLHLIPVEKVKELLLGINSLAVDLENEFIYRGQLLRNLANVLEESRKTYLQPNEN